MCGKFLYTNAMIHGYGYRRARQELTAAGAEAVWIDTDAKRQERNAMLRNSRAIRSGDSLLILHETDLGEDARDRARVRAELEQRNIPITILDSPPTRQDVGRPLLFNPSADQDAEFGPVWYGPFTAAYVRVEFERIFGYPMDKAARDRVQYRYGPRDGSRWLETVPRVAAE